MAALTVIAVFAGPHSVQAEARQTQDFFVGNGTAGPYTLSWKNVLAGTETVQVNNLPMTWGVDYTLDPATGTLTFTHPLPAQAGAAIHYGYDTQQAQPQGNGLKLPLTMALNDNVSVSGLYSHAETDGDKPGALNMGLNGGWQGANDGKFTTHLLFVPALTGTDSQATPNGLARLGFAAGGQTRLGKPLQVAFGFSRAGLGVGNAGSDNWQAGVQKMTFNAAFDPARQVQATFGYAQSDPASGPGPSQSKINAALALTPSDKVQVKTGLVQTEGGGSGPTQTLTASAAVRPLNQTELDASFARKDAPGSGSDTQNMDIKAAVTGQRLSVTAAVGQSAAGAGGTTQTLNAGAVVKPLNATELDASFSQMNAPGQANDAQALNLKAALGAGKPLSLTASLDQTTQGTQDTDAQAIHLSLNPRPSFQLNTGLSRRQTPTANTQIAAVDGKMQPWAFLLLSGGYQWRTVTPTQTGGAVDGNYDSSSAQFTLAPKSALHLIGTYAQNPDDAGGNPQRLAKHGLGLEATLGALSLTGGYDWSCQYAAPTVGTSVHVGLGLRFSAATQLTGDYKQDLTGLGDAPPAPAPTPSA